MNICFINFNRKWSGVKTWMLDFGIKMQEKGHHITVIIRPETNFHEACVRAGFNVYSFTPGMKFNPASIIRIVYILKKEKIDITTVNISKDVNIGAIASRLAGIPVLHRVGLPGDYKDSWMEKLHHRLMSAVIVPSHYLKDELDKKGWLTKEIEVVYNSKLPNAYKPHTVRERSPLVIGVTSQLTVPKGHIYLLKAVERLLRKGVEVRLRIAGTGKAEQDLKMYAEQHLPAGIAEFRGFTTDIPGFLAGLDIFVLPSTSESFGNTLLEAMFAGLPCIAFDTEGMPEVLGKTGILTPPRDAETLADNIALLAKNAELRREYSRKARARAMAVYNIEVNKDLLEEVFEKYRKPKFAGDQTPQPAE